MGYESGERWSVLSNETTFIKAQIVNGMCMNFNAQVVNTYSVIYFNENFLNVR